MMKTFRAIVLLAAFVFSLSALADDVIRIEVGRDYKGYSNSELRRRMWDLERAVMQLQTRVFQLEVKPVNVVAPIRPWTCTLQSFGTTHVASESSRMAALAMVLKKCSDATNAVHC